MQRFVRQSAPSRTLKTPFASSRLARNSRLSAMILPDPVPLICHHLRRPSPIVAPTETAFSPRSLLPTLTPPALVVASLGPLIPPRHFLGVRRAPLRSSNTPILTSSRRIPPTLPPRYPKCFTSSSSSSRSSCSTNGASIRWQSYTRRTETRSLAQMLRASGLRARRRFNSCSLLSRDTRIYTS